MGMGGYSNIFLVILGGGGRGGLEMGPAYQQDD